MKKNINFFRTLFRSYRLKKRGIDYKDLKRLVDCAKFLELNSRSSFYLTYELLRSFNSEVENENIKK